MDAETNNKASDSITLMDEGYSSSHVNQFCKVMFGSEIQPDYNPDQHSQRISPVPSSKASTDAHPQRSIPDPNSPPDYISTQYSHRNFPVSQAHPDLTSPRVPQKNIQITNQSSFKAVPSTEFQLDSSSISIEQDDDKMFLLSLLPYFKKFSEEQKLQARINVSKIIHDMLYKQP